MVDIPNNIQIAAKESSDLLDELLEKFDDHLLAVLREIDTEIQFLLRKLDVNKDGKITFTEVNLKRALALRPQIIRIVKERYGELLSVWVATSDRVAEFALTQLRAIDILDKSASFTTFDTTVIEALRMMGLEELKTKDVFTSQEVARKRYILTLFGGNYKDLVNAIKAKLKSLKAGISRTTAETLAHDSLMQTYATVQNIKAIEAGSDRFLYFGSLVRDSRPFCVERAGKIFTREQIEKWNNETWEGKIPGLNVFIQRGGYGCRHHLSAIPKGITEEDIFGGLGDEE